MNTHVDADAMRRDIETLQRTVEDLRRTIQWQQYGARFRARLCHMLRPDAAILVAAKGDDDLLALGARRTAHFPQALDGQYAGAYPGEDVAAIAHLEALRGEGYDTLIFPAFADWWLCTYAGLRAHLDAHYQVDDDNPLCTIVDLRGHGAARPASALAQVVEAMRGIERHLEREPTLLDWGTGLNLQAACPEYSVAASNKRDRLPHFDRSLDIVALSAGSRSALAEARRVADAAVIVVRPKDSVVDIQWLVPPPAAPDLPAPARAGAMQPGEPLAIPGPNGRTLLIWMAEGLTLLPGWLGPITSIFERDPSAGAVGGRIVDFTGRLVHAGGSVLADGSLRSIGEGDERPGSPRYAFVRPVDFCSSWFMAVTKRAFEAAGGFDDTLPAGLWRDADFGLRLREHGYTVYVHPESTAVCSRMTTRMLRSFPREQADRQQLRRFAERWKTALRSRSAVVDTWGTAVYSRLPLTILR